MQRISYLKLWLRQIAMILIAIYCLETMWPFLVTKRISFYPFSYNSVLQLKLAPPQGTKPTTREQLSLDTLKKYLLSLGNSERIVLKFFDILEKYSKEGRQILLEVGGGNTDVANEISKKNPQIGIITVDLYDHLRNHSLLPHIIWADEFKQGILSAQQSKENNIVVLKADFFELLPYLPKNSLDFILAVSPEYSVILKLLHRIEKLVALKPNGKIIIVPYHEPLFNKDCPNKFLVGEFLFRKTNINDLFGVNVYQYSFYKSRDPFFVWEKGNGDNNVRYTEGFL